MKISFITAFFLLVCSLLFAADSEFKYVQPEPMDVEKTPDITVVIEKKSYNCKLDPLSKIYICPNGKNPLLVKYSMYGSFAALTKDKDNRATLLSVSAVKTPEKVIYDYSAYEMAASPPSPPNDLTNNITKQLFAIDGFLELGPFSGNKVQQRQIGTAEYENIIKDYLDVKTKLEELKQTIFKEENYQVELSDGKKLSCTRGEKRSLNNQDNDWQKNMNVTIQCGAFDCGNIAIDGKEYQASMLYETTPGNFSSASIHITDKDGTGPKPVIRKVSSPNSKIPLVDHSIYLDHPEKFKPTTYPGQDPMPPTLTDTPENRHFALYKDTNFSASLAYNENVCDKNNNAIKNISKARDKAFSDLANMELAQFITVLSNGSLVGLYVDPNEAAKYGCIYGGLYLNNKAAENLDILKKNIYPDQHVDKTISLNRATELFNKARAMDDIAWDYKQDGCYARAHLMARRFEAEGVRVDKVWIKGDLYVPEVDIGWNFHVAPIVYVEDEKGIIKKMVIDPSLFDKPVTVEEWDQKMTKRTKKGSVITAFPFPQNAALMERSALSFSSSDPYLPGDNISMTEADKMEMADETMKTYKAIGGQNQTNNYYGERL